MLNEQRTLSIAAMQVIRRNGDVVAFQPDKIAVALTKAFLAVEGSQGSASSRIRDLVAPFNKKGIAIEDSTTFAGDLEFDSLTVMDFVAEIEDAFDVIISMNQQAEIESWGDLVDAVAKMASQ